MQSLWPPLAALAGLLFTQLLPPAAPPATWHLLTAADRSVAQRASLIAQRDENRAQRWLNRQPDVASAVLGPDRRSIGVDFRDGGRLVMLSWPHGAEVTAARLHPFARLTPSHADDTAAARALVLEPFADQLGRGPGAGQEEADALSKAGFHVDLLRGSDVTVSAMENLSSYAVVYMETHSNVLPDGDALIVTDETNTAPYGSLYLDGSLRQACIAGDDCRHLYNAFTAQFVSAHLGAFPDGSILFLNGCAVLKAPLFWSALQAKNVDALLSWDDEAYSSVTETTGSFVVNQLQAGATVDSSVQDAVKDGLGLSAGLAGTAHLGFLGDGNATLAAALSGKKPTATATPTSTATSTPTPKPAKKCKRRDKKHPHRRCKRK